MIVIMAMVAISIILVILYSVVGKHDVDIFRIDEERKMHLQMGSCLILIVIVVILDLLFVRGVRTISNL